MAKRMRVINGEQRRYEWALYLTRAQADTLRAQAIACAELYNACLEICEARYHAAGQRETKYYYDKRGNLRQTFTGRMLSFHCGNCASLSEATGKTKLCDKHKLPSEYDMGAWCKPLREACPEWRAMSSCTPQRIVGALSQAWERFFSNVARGEIGGYPRYKNKYMNLSIPHRVYESACRKKGNPRCGEPTGSGCELTKSDRHERSWWWRLAGVPELIWARGQLPAKINELTYADVMFRDRRWIISVAVVIDKRRESWGKELTPITVKFDLIDGFVLVNGIVETPSGLLSAQILDERRQAMQSDFDLRWPRRKRVSDAEWGERCEVKADISRLASRIARIRKNALHVWTKRIVERASELKVIKPAVKQLTVTPRGDEKNWGAQVEMVSAVNRMALSYAPAMAAAMLEYKAKEIGIRCDIVEDDDAPINIGRELVATGKVERRLKRQIKKELQYV